MQTLGESIFKKFLFSFIYETINTSDNVLAIKKDYIK